MTLHRFVAQTPDGRRVTGTRAAASPAQVVASLREGGLLALKVVPAHGLGEALRWNPRYWLPVRKLDVELGLRQLAFLLQSGVALLSALEICEQQSTRLRLGEAWRRVAQDVRSGSSLRAALARARCFPAVAISLASVGEETGNLDQVLRRAADSLERQRVRRQEVLTALTYPAIVLVLAIGAVAYMVGGLIPKLSRFLTSIGRTLPAPTQLLVDLSDFVRTNGTLLWICLFSTAAMLLLLGAQPVRARWTDAWLLRVPLIGSVIRLAATAAVSHNVALMLASGVRLTAAMETVAPLIANARLQALLLRARARVLQGSSLAASLAGVGNPFGTLLTSSCAVGESSGNLDEVLAESAAYHDERLRGTVRRLGSIVEPMILIMIGSIVGFVYIAFFMAIYAAAGANS